MGFFFNNFLTMFLHDGKHLFQFELLWINFNKLWLTSIFYKWWMNAAPACIKCQYNQQPCNRQFVHATMYCNISWVNKHSKISSPFRFIIPVVFLSINRGEGRSVKSWQLSFDRPTLPSILPSLLGFQHSNPGSSNY